MIARIGDRTSGEMGMGSDGGDLVSGAVTIAVPSCRLSSPLVALVVGLEVEGLKDASEARATADAISFESIFGVVVESFFVLFDSEAHADGPKSPGRFTSVCKTISSTS